MRSFGVFTAEDLDALTTRAGLTAEQRLRTRAAAAVLGFRTTSYVTDELIDWSAAPEDPIYRIVFPSEDMLPAGDVTRIVHMLRHRAPPARVAAAARQARAKLADDHIPPRPEEILPGAYRTCHDTVMVFPVRQQATSPYGISCFDRIPFRPGPRPAMTVSGAQRLTGYLTAHPEVTCVHLAGQDPLAMAAPALRAYIEPFLQVAHLEAIRIDTSALAYWPHRFRTDPGADDTLRLFSQAAASGKALALVARFCHPRQLRSGLIVDAVRRINGAGAVIRTQVPLIGSVNDEASILAAMWRVQVRMGMVPSAVVIERVTGIGGKFTVPLARAHDIFAGAYAQVTGLARTVRGPAMPASPGTVCVDGTAEIGGQKMFVLRFTQARDPDLIGRPFFATFDPHAAWFTELKPVPGAPFPDVREETCL